MEHPREQYRYSPPISHADVPRHRCPPLPPSNRYDPCPSTPHGGGDGKARVNTTLINRSKVLEYRSQLCAIAPDVNFLMSLFVSATMPSFRVEPCQCNALLAPPLRHTGRHRPSRGCQYHGCKDVPARQVAYRPVSSTNRTALTHSQGLPPTPNLASRTLSPSTPPLLQCKNMG
jgi:hypothetical protein